MKFAVSLFAAVIGTAFFLNGTMLQAQVVNWIGPSGNWSDPLNWDNVPPNAAGATAQYTTGASRTTTQDVAGGVTVGTLKVLGTQNASWQITPNNGVFLNQDGAGPLGATVLNDIQTATPAANPAIFLNAPGAGFTGSFVLQDDLYLINTSNSARTTGSIQIRGPITGSGNIYIENVSNNIAAGQVQFTNSQSNPGVGGFGGNVFIKKGAVTFQRGDVFTPSPGNIVTLGVAGGTDDVTLAYNRAGGLGNIENGFIAAATNPSAKIVFANANTTADSVQIKTTNTNAAAIQLDGNLIFDNRNTLGSIFIIGDRVTGVGKLTKIGVGAMELTNANTYAGGTVVSEGSLKVRHADAFNNGFGFHDASDGTLGSGDVTVETTATRLEIDATLSAIDVIANTATLSLAGGGTLGLADLGYAQLGAGINETVGALVLGGTLQAAGTYGSTSSGATFKNDEFFAGAGMITVGSVVVNDADFDNDSDVDGNDFLIWQRGLSVGTDNSTGDANGSGTVDAADLAVWQGALGGAAAVAAGAIPEPGCIALALAALPLALRVRRKR